MEEVYDIIYDGAGSDIYDEIYDGLMPDIYDYLYDGILDDSSVTQDYSEWLDYKSDEYDWWLDSRSDIYDDWLDFRSEVYDFWLDIRSELWSDDFEKAVEITDDFRKDIDKMKEDINDDAVQEETGKKEEDGQAAPSQVVEEDNQTEIKEEQQSDEKTPSFQAEKTETESRQKTQETNSANGMRQEFKEAMDSYEAFYDEYCDFMVKYKENPADLNLLAEYGDMMEEMTKMNEAFKGWEDEGLNEEELNYYIEVNNRITQKLLELAS